MESSTAPSNRSFVGWVFFIWRIRWIQLRSRLKRASEVDRFRDALLAMIFAAFMVSVTYLFERLFSEFLSIPILGQYVLYQTLQLIFLSFFFLLIFSSMVTSIGTQYMSSDLSFLFAKPIPKSVIYWVKMGEALFHSTWMVIVFGYPILVSFGASIGASWDYYIWAFLILVPFFLIPVCLGNFVVHTILYWIPIKRVRAVIVSIGIFFGMFMVYVLRLLQPRILFEPEIARDMFMGFLDTIEIGAVTGLPSYHASTALYRISIGVDRPVFIHIVWLIGLAVASLLPGLLFAQRWYPVSWLRTREGEHSSSSEGAIEWSTKLTQFIPTPYRGLIRKELRRFVRQTTQWSQLLVLMGIVVVHVANLSEIPSSNVFLNYTLYFFNIALIGFVLTAICVRFVFPSISFEGEYFWIIRTAPFSMYQFFLQKVVFYVLPLCLIGSILIVTTNAFLTITWTLWFWSLVLVFSMSITLTAGALAAGAVFPKFDFDHFGEVVTSAGSVLYMLCGLFYVAGLIGFVLLPLISKRSFYSASPEILLEWYSLLVLVGSGLSILMAWVLLWIAARSIQSYEFSSM